MKAGDFGDRFPAAGYIRLSREDGDREESDSVMNQKKLIQSFLASREDLELEGFYVDATDIIGLKQNPTKRASL